MPAPSSASSISSAKAKKKEKQTKEQMSRVTGIIPLPRARAIFANLETKCHTAEHQLARNKYMAKKYANKNKVLKENIKKWRREQGKVAIQHMNGLPSTLGTSIVPWGPAQDP